MKNQIIMSLIGISVVSAFESSAFTVYTPPDNIVQNGSFQSLFADWSGSSQAVLSAWPSIPNNNAMLATDIYQNLATVPGQQYSLSFYAAADLYFAPRVTFEVAINNQALASTTTPSYTYNPGVNRYDQMRWVEYTDTFVASSSSTKLEFIDEDTYDFGLAAVSVVPAPEPATITFLTGAGAFVLVRWAVRKRVSRLHTKQSVRR